MKRETGIVLEYYYTVKDIYSVPCARTTVCGIWAYLDYADGRRIYRYDSDKDVWGLYEETIVTNF